MELTNRQFLLLKLLYGSSAPISGTDLTRILNISPRTLRYDITAINALARRPLILSCKSGYYFDDHQESRRILNDISCFDTSKLQKQIAMELLQRKECSIYDLCEQVYASESTIYKIVKLLLPYFNQFNLQIIRHGEMLQTRGDENDKRILLAHCIHSDANELATSLTYFSSFFTLFTLQDIRDIVVRNLDHFHIHMDDLYLKNIIVSIAISVQRVYEGHAIDRLPSAITGNDYFLQRSVLNSICDEIDGRFHIRITGNDFETLLIFLSGSIKDSSLEGAESIMQDRDFTAKIDAIIDRTFHHFGITADLSRFVQNLYVHIYFMLLRVEAKNTFQNSFTASIKNSHPFLYDVAVYLSYLLGQSFQVKLPDDEIGLLAIYIGTNFSAIAEYPKARVILICPNYNSLQETILEQINHYFSEQIEVVGILSSFEALTDQVPYDFIISSLGSTESIANCVFIDILFTPYNRHQIEKEILKHSKKQKRLAFHHSVLPYFHPDLFFYNAPYTEGSAILAHINRILLDKQIVPETYLQSVYKREELSSTAFFNQFAVAHSLDVNGYRSVVAYYYSDAPIDWFGQEIHLVLVLVSSGYSESFAKLYNLLFDILMDKNLYTNLIQCTSLEEIIQYLEDQY